MKRFWIFSKNKKKMNYGSASATLPNLPLSKSMSFMKIFANCKDEDIGKCAQVSSKLMILNINSSF
jgi:hypothetical protein